MSTNIHIQINQVDLENWPYGNIAIPVYVVKTFIVRRASSAYLRYLALGYKQPLRAVLENRV
jgi:hypothetical protein